MKKLAFILLLFSLSGHSQVNNFVALNNRLVWENVFITNEANIPGLISRHPRLKIISSDNKIYKGQGTAIRNTCPGTSSYMDSEFSFNFEIEIGEGKYRVTVSDIVLSKTGKTSTAETYFLDKGTLKKTAKTPRDMECLEEFFNRLFTRTTLLKNKA